MPYDFDETLWSQYEDMGICGCGGCSQIKLAKHRLTGILVAIKILEKEFWLFNELAIEVDVLKSANHPNIVTLFQVIETKEKIYLVLELCTRSLSQLIRQEGHLKEDEARRIFWEILQAIRYCHDHGIAHRDIKPNNIMLDFVDKVILIDFGMATQFRPGEKFTYRCGGYTYQPPELYQHQPYDATKKDIWSLGILLCYMVTGRIPFKDTTLLDFKQRVLAGEYEVPHHISSELAELIRLLLNVDPDLRPPVSQLITHAWLQQCRGGSCHNEETLPQRLDPDILEVMRTMGFDPHETHQSIITKKYDQSMATYLLIQYGAACIRRRGTGPDKPVLPGTMPFPITDPAAFPLHQERRETVPVLQAGSSVLKVQESEESQQPEQKSCMSARLPSVPLSCPQNMPTVSPSPKHLCPGITFPSHIRESSESMLSFQTPEELSAETSRQGPCGQRSSPQHQEGASIPYGAEEAPAAPSSGGAHGQGSSPQHPEGASSPYGTEEDPAAPSSQGTHGQGSSLQHPEGASSPYGTEDPAAPSSQGTHGQGSSLQHPEEASSPYGTEEGPAALSSLGPQGPERPAAHHRGLRCWEVCRRIGNCVRTLCRRLRTSHPFKNRVAPVTVPGPNCQPFTSGSPPRPPGRPPGRPPPSPPSPLPPTTSPPSPSPRTLRK